jgi:hypothetical protein
MRLLPLVAVLLLTGCRQPQPGCSVENCRLMIEACRVEFAGSPADLAICTGFDRPTSPVDYSSYCVDACNAHSGNGELATCVASKADACRGARDAGLTFSQVYDSCLDKTAKAPNKACEDACYAKQRTCNDPCSGGKPCDTCLRAGRSDCAMYCTDAGYKACLDCSGQCGLQFVACTDQCPRE